MIAEARGSRAGGPGPLTREAEGYWAQSRQPWPSLVFIAPLLVVYEAGVLWMGPGAVRNGADAWLRQLLDWIGFDEYFLLPFLAVCVLLGWHYTTRRPWRLSRGLLGGMAAECLLLTVCLWFLARLQGTLLRTVAEASGQSGPARIQAGVSYLGAGIYEELLFRLILLTLAVWGFRRLGLRSGPGLLAGMLLSSLLFSAAHYVGTYGEPLELSSFVFRFLAGMFFAVLFVCRGFGIAAGVHAGYDILVGVVASA